MVVLDKPASVYVMTLWWHSRADPVANAELVETLTTRGFLDAATHDVNNLDDIDAAVRTASQDDTTRELLAHWCEKTRDRRESSGVTHPSHWLPRATEYMATATDPDAAQRHHQLVMGMIANMPTTDASDPATVKATSEYFQTYTTRLEHWERSSPPSPSADQP